jgi:HNH endonuclease
MSDDWYRNQAISKDNARVFQPANRCIYCEDGRAPFTREHVIPRGLGGGIIFPKASCEECRKITHDIETYCLRGPWLSHRLNLGLVNDLKDLGRELKMPGMIDNVRHEKVFTPEEFPNYLILPEFHDSPGLLTGRMDGTGRFSFTIWGDERTKQLHGDGAGNAILAERFDLNKCSRAIAKIAHGFVAGEYGLKTSRLFCLH